MKLRYTGFLLCQAPLGFFRGRKSGHRRIGAKILLLSLLLIGLTLHAPENLPAEDAASQKEVTGEATKEEPSTPEKALHFHENQAGDAEHGHASAEAIPETIHDIVPGDEQPDQGVPGVSTTIQISEDALSPQTLVVSPGATVVWVNNAPHKVKIRFTDKSVSATCQAPRGFKLDAKGIFRSEELAADGGVASLCFLERSTYVFEVEHLSPKNLDSEDPDKKVLQVVIGTIRVAQK